MEGPTPTGPSRATPVPPAIEADPPALRPLQLSADQGPVTLEADVCVVGSGSGGGVVAGELATAGFDVVVLEAGPHLEDADFPPDELTALRRMYWRGGAHQMGTARMGTDPRTSVADPDGQLHDTPGVWIGDTSAFPTAVGSNPMVTCMALARRTAHAIVAAG